MRNSLVRIFFKKWCWDILLKLILLQGASAGRIHVGGVDVWWHWRRLFLRLCWKIAFMSQEGMFVVVLTVQWHWRLLISSRHYSRGFITCATLKSWWIWFVNISSKKARSFSLANMIWCDQKKLKMIMHILYDQTSWAPIVIPVINEVGGLKPVKSAATPTHSAVKLPAR